VGDNGRTVLRDLDVELERGDADPHPVAEARERALGAMGEPAAVGLDVEASALRIGVSVGRKGGDEEGEERGRCGAQRGPDHGRAGWHGPAAGL
jgi:hypothetical protein